MYSWLDCQPEDLFRLTTYSLRDVQSAHPALQYLTQWGQHFPGIHLFGPWLAYIAAWSFTALPMQVSVDILPPVCS